MMDCTGVYYGKYLFSFVLKIPPFRNRPENEDFLKPELQHSCHIVHTKSGSFWVSRRRGTYFHVDSKVPFDTIGRSVSFPFSDNNHKTQSNRIIISKLKIIID